MLASNNVNKHEEHQQPLSKLIFMLRSIVAVACMRAFACVCMRLRAIAGARACVCVCVCVCVCIDAFMFAFVSARARERESVWEMVKD